MLGSRHPSRLLVAATLVALLPVAPRAGASPGPGDGPRPSLDGVYALKGARVVTGAGSPIEKGVVVVRDGLVQAVGAEGSVEIPFDATVIDGSGLVVYPGFVDAGTDAGVDAELEKKRKENAPGGAADAVRDVIPEMPRDNRHGIFADVEATELLKIEPATFASLREAGFVAGEVAPKRGAVRGYGAVLSFGDAAGAEALDLDTSLHLAFDYSGGGYPSTLFGVIAHLRQTFFDAERYEADLADYERHGMKGRRRPPVDPSLARLATSRAPVVFEANDHEDVHRALRLAEELKLDLRIGGGSEAWKLAARLREKNVPVLLDLAAKDEPTKKDAGKKSSGESGSSGGPGYELGLDDGCCDDVLTSGAALEEEEPAAPPRREGGRRPGGGGGRGEGGDRAEGGDREAKPAGDEKPGEKEAEKKEPVYPWDAAEKARDAIREAAIYAEDHAEWEESVKGPSVLSGAGVRIAFRTGSATDKKKALAAARTFVEHGLDRDAALRAMTIEPARLLGLDARLGTIEPGKIASFSAFTGDLFDKDSAVRYVFVEGKKFEFEPKKKARERDGDKKDGAEAKKPTSVAGTWEATAKSSMGEIQFELQLEQDGSTLKGKLASKQFGRDFPLEGSIEGDEIEATVTMSFGGDSAEIKLSATVTGGNAMSGTSTSTFSEEEGEFTAKKTSGPKGRS